MRNLTNALYTYAQENRIPDYLQTGEYRRAAYRLEEGWETFRSTLTEGQNQELDALLSQGYAVECFEDKAGFLAGIAIGLDLGRL